MTGARSRRGLTIYELVIAVAILSLILTGLASFGRSSAAVTVARTTQSDLDARLRRTLVRVSRELMVSGTDTFVPGPLAPGSDRVEYRRSEGVSNGAIVWSTPFRIELQLEQGELDDGLDNNGNGLVDERVVVWTRELEGIEQETVWCHGVRELLQGEVENGVDDNGNGLVDEPGLCFEQVDGTVRVRLSLERLDASGRPYVRTLETRVRPRN